MKKAMIVVSVLLLSVMVIANTGARIQMRNGDIIECEIGMESISFITDYGEFKIPVSFVREIAFPAPGSMATTLATVYEKETFSGFLLNEYISLEFEGSPLKFHKDFISRIDMYNEKEEINKDIVHVSLKTGDQFYGEMLSKQATVQSSYAEIKIKTDNVVNMEFEGDGNVLTKVKFESGSEIKGTIKDDFIVFKLLSGSELGVSPGKIKSIVFLKEVIAEVPDAKESEKKDTSTPVTSQTSEKPSSTTSTKAPENMVFVERGSFTMGDTWGDGYNDEKPTHKVTFTYDFYMGKYEVTFDEYDAFCNATGLIGPKDEGWGRGQRPVINVSWWDAIAYCNWLSDKENLPKAYDDKGNFLDKDGRVTTDPSKVVGYRLPTEAEWEYAARGGNKSKGYKYAGSNTIDEVAWYYSNSGKETQEVGKKAPNELGLYDMSGNVREWCSDHWYDYTAVPKTNPYNITRDSNPVLRGGCWYNGDRVVRVVYRSFYSPTATRDGIGFRIARTVH